MQKIRTGLILAIIASVFIISFLIGRATALRDSDEKRDDYVYTGIVNPWEERTEKEAEVSRNAEKVPDVISEKKETKKIQEKTPEKMSFPCGKTVTKEYSQMAVYSETMGDWRAHTGIDYAAEEGTVVKCVYDGKVARIYEDKLWGHTIEILHEGNLKSVYKNLNGETEIVVGQEVKEGQAIGKAGKSAVIESFETPHIHFELWQDDIVINPESYLFE